MMARGIEMRAILRLAGLALIFSALHAPPSFAQSATQCPLSIVGQYGRVAEFEHETPPIPIAPFQQGARANQTLRLIQAGIAVGAYGYANTSEMPEDGPGNTLRWVIWDGRGAPPAAGSNIVCDYEGGATLVFALPRTIRTCTATITSQRQPAGSASRREILTRASFSCQ
jgi:hypothetical protein